MRNTTLIFCCAFAALASCKQPELDPVTVHDRGGLSEEEFNSIGTAAANPAANMEARRLVQVRPSERQVAWHELGYYAFIHFGINTFENLEWSCGDSYYHPASRYNPTNLDAAATDQWVQSLKDAGMKGVILTAKHHDGFCLWDTQTTDYKATSTKVPAQARKDVVELLSRSCEKFGLKMGIYLSMADGHADFNVHIFGDNPRPVTETGERLTHKETYTGTDRNGDGIVNYNDYYLQQLEELFNGEKYGVMNTATGKREFFSLWLDGAQPNWLTKPMTYDFAAVYTLARKLQPNVVISNAGPDVGWIGNEDGSVLASSYSVLPSMLADGRYVMSESQTDPGLPPNPSGGSAKLDPALGNRTYMAPFKNLMWYPFEADVSLRVGSAGGHSSRWFYRTPGLAPTNKCGTNSQTHAIADDGPKSGNNTAEWPLWSLQDLLKLYERTVGGNVGLLLNVPPDKTGRFNQTDVTRLKELGDALNKIYDENLLAATGVTVTASPAAAPAYPVANILTDDDTYWRPAVETEGLQTITIKLPEVKDISHVVLQEQIRQGQRIEEYVIEGRSGSGQWRQLYPVTGKGTTVGYKKICRFTKTNVSELRIKISKSRLYPTLRFVGAYLDKNNPPIIQ